MSTISFHSGFCLLRANMSQMALLTAPVAMWITPFSGPILDIKSEHQSHNDHQKKKKKKAGSERNFPY
jgi:hypothetical protein